jgi:hypothetical protein
LIEGVGAVVAKDWNLIEGKGKLRRGLCSPEEFIGDGVIK